MIAVAGKWRAEDAYRSFKLLSGIDFIEILNVVY